MKICNGKCYDHDMLHVYETVFNNNSEIGTTRILVDLEKELLNPLPATSSTDAIDLTVSDSKPMRKKRRINIYDIEVYDNTLFVRFYFENDTSSVRDIFWRAYSLVDGSRFKSFEVMEKRTNDDRLPATRFLNGFMMIPEATQHYNQAVSFRMMYELLSVGSEPSDDISSTIQAAYAFDIRVFNVTDLTKQPAERRIPVTECFAMHGEHIVSADAQKIYFCNYVVPKSPMRSFEYDTTDDNRPTMRMVCGHYFVFFKKMRIMVIDLKSFRLVASKVLGFPEAGSPTSVWYTNAYRQNVFIGVHNEKSYGKVMLYWLNLAELGLGEETPTETRRLSFSSLFNSAKRTMMSLSNLDVLCPTLVNREFDFGGSISASWFRGYYYHSMRKRVNMFTGVEESLKIPEPSVGQYYQNTFHLGSLYTQWVSSGRENEFNGYPRLRIATDAGPPPDPKPLLIVEDFFIAFCDSYNPAVPMEANSYYAPLVQKVRADVSEINYLYKLMEIVCRPAEIAAVANIIAELHRFSDPNNIREVN